MKTVSKFIVTSGLMVLAVGLLCGCATTGPPIEAENVRLKERGARVYAGPSSAFRGVMAGGTQHRQRHK